MAKSTISRQNSQKSTGIQSWYRYPLYRGGLVSVPKVGLSVPIQIRMKLSEKSTGTHT